MNFFLPVIGSMSVVGAAMGAVYYATYAVRSQWLGPTVWHGRRDTRSVSLTFDDGPSEDTDLILDVLETHNLLAAFFMIGRNVDRFPQTARRIVAAGHEVGNHSYSHPVYLYRRAQRTRRELELTQAAIMEATGLLPKIARPPCGVRTSTYFSEARRLGLRTVQWDVAAFDWNRLKAKQISRNVLRRASAGSIVLLHDGDSEGKRNRRETAKALPLIIKGLRDAGLSIVPLAELLPESELEPKTLGRGLNDRTANA
jgi:peptidoglycan/xylan/chitin deacetylase (PgdA/CDA1 family)